MRRSKQKRLPDWIVVFFTMLGVMAVFALATLVEVGF
jgi:hypothetical protein